MRPVCISRSDVCIVSKAWPSFDRPAPTQSVWLRSGDVVVMGGAARLAFHGIDRVRHGNSSLLPKGGRINLTLRVVAG